MRLSQLLILFITLTVLWGAGTGAYGQDIRYNGSVQYATGSYYFTEQTSSLYFNNGIGFSSEKITAYVSIPLITQNTPWISYTSAGGIGALPTGGPSSNLVGHSPNNSQGNRMGRRKIDPGSTDTVNFAETNFGDPSLSTSLKLWDSGFGQTSISGNVGVKLPLADPNSGFGTGGWDVGAGLSWSQRVSDHYLFILNGMYWKLGDMDELDFNNILTYSAAIGRSFKGGNLMTTASLFGSTEIIEGIDPPVSLGAGLSYQLSPQWGLNTNVLFGLTESASDFSIGLGWSVKL